MEGSLRLAVSCAPVRRLVAKDEYDADCYEVCLRRDGTNSYCFMSQEVANKSQNFTALLLKELEQRYNLTAKNAYSLSVTSEVDQSVSLQTVSLFFVVPVSSSLPTQGVEFISLTDLLNNPGILTHSRQSVLAIDQWLRERHLIPTITLNHLFLSSEEEEEEEVSARGSVVQQLVQNPLHQARVSPPEDTLVIALNNPIFSASAS